VGLGDHDMIPIYVSIAQTLSDLKKYDEAIAYFMKELDCRHGEHKQVRNEHLTLSWWELFLIGQWRRDAVQKVIKLADCPLWALETMGVGSSFPGQRL